MWDNIKYFVKAQTSNIIVTIIGGFVPVILNGIIKMFDSFKNSNKISFDISNFKISNIGNYAIHSVFIFITLYVLIQIRKNTMHDIKNNKGQIKQYMLKNCGLKIYDQDETIESAFKTVQVSASQFFYAWLVVWLVWLIFYAGEFLLSMNFEDCSYYSCKMVMKSFEQTFDFLNSTALISIYIILTNVTVNYKKRAKNNNTYLEFILVWMILLIICVSGILTENYCPESVFAHVMPFYISTVSTISFVLILGKLNSIYLKIPSFFMYVLYVYAFIQAYIPLRELEIKDNGWIKSFLSVSVPYFTLLGKVVLMLTICWISVQRRFIFYLIHRSTTIDKAEELLSELNKEKVSF